jgi:hypothetical protein
MTTIAWRGNFARVCLVIWLVGLALIICYAPADYRVLRLSETEQVAAFRGNSHELITVAGGLERDKRRGREQRPKAVHHLMPLFGNGRRGDSIYLWDLDRGTKRQLDVGALGTVYAVTPGRTCDRLCITFGPARPLARDREFRIAVVDAQTGKPIRVVQGIDVGFVSISDDGKRLVYSVSAGRERPVVICVDIDTGKLLHREIAEYGFLSADGRYLATCQGLHMQPWAQTIIDLDQHRIVNRIQPLTTGTISAFSPHADKFMDWSGDVWDIRANKVIDHFSGFCVFVDGGEQVARIEHLKHGLTLQWHDIQSYEKLFRQPAAIRKRAERKLPIREDMGIGIESVDGQGNLIHIGGACYNSELTWLQKILKRIGYPPSPRWQEYHQWLLMDGRSGEIVHGGTGTLLAVSTDGRYAVTGDDESSSVQVYELPVRRSILVMMISAAVWTSIVGIVWGWWKMPRGAVSWPWRRAGQQGLAAQPAKEGAVSAREVKTMLAIVLGLAGSVLFRVAQTRREFDSTALLCLALSIVCIVITMGLFYSATKPSRRI